MRIVGRGHLSRDFQAFAVDIAANQRVNKKSSDTDYLCFGILDLTGGNPQSTNGCVCLPGRLWPRNIARRSCCDRNYAPTGHLWSGCLRR